MRRGVAAFARLAVALAAGNAFAAEPDAPALDRLNLSGSVRGGYWSSDRNLDDRRNFTPGSVWLKAAPDLGSGFSARGEAWIAGERSLDGAAPAGELREGFLAWRGERVNLSVGRRLVAWGRADRVNPTDVLASRDYTLLFPDDDDQRRGSFMTTGAYGFGDFTASLIWAPEFRPNILPLPEPAGVTIREEGDRFDPAQFAVRLDHTGGDLDWALTYFNGVDRNPDFRLTGVTPTAVSIGTVHRRIEVWGADFATNVGDYGIRGEAAFSLPEGRSTADLFDKRPFLAAVLGADRNVGEHLNVNVQYVVHQVTDYDDPRDAAAPFGGAVVRAALVNNQLNETQHGPTLRIAYSGLNDTLGIELVGVGLVSDGSFALRPKVTYAISDNVKAIAGADLFFGDADSFFGQLRQNRVFYVELRYGF